MDLIKIIMDSKAFSSLEPENNCIKSAVNDVLTAVSPMALERVPNQTFQNIPTVSQMLRWQAVKGVNQNRK